MNINIVPSCSILPVNNHNTGLAMSFYFRGYFEFTILEPKHYKKKNTH